LQFIPQKLITPEMVLAMVTQDERALMHVPNELRTYEFWDGWYATPGGNLDASKIPAEFREEIVHPLVKAAQDEDDR